MRVENGACAWLHQQSLHLLPPVLDAGDQGRKAGSLTPLPGCRLAMLGVTDHLVHERLSADQYSHWGILLEQKVGRAAETHVCYIQPTWALQLECLSCIASPST